MALVAGCGLGDAEPAADAELTVYVSTPKSGPLAADGREIVAGTREALTEAGGEAGGVAVRASYVEAANDPAAIAANARRAVEDSTSIAYIGELDATATLSSLPITNEARMLQLSPTADDPELVAPFDGSDEVPPETQSTGERTYATLAGLGGDPRALGRESMALVLDAIERADDSLDRASVATALLATANRESPLGGYSIDEVGVAEPAG
jgi:ABC-type branched-subunit amino acid transport system substrate-binding protein